jgi:hypothetical protein
MQFFFICASKKKKGNLARAFFSSFKENRFLKKEKKLEKKV